MSQVPDGAQGFAAGVLAYSLVSELSIVLMVWLMWTPKEGFSYLALMSYLLFLATTISIIQQVYDNLFWVDVMTASFQKMQAEVGNPVLAISSATAGVDYALFFIQYYCYVASSNIAAFWGFSLTQIVYGWADKVHLQPMFRTIDMFGKTTSIVMPAVMICLLQLKGLQSSTVAYFAVANAEFMLGVTGGCIAIIMILFKYITTRRRLKGAGALPTTTRSGSRPRSRGGSRPGRPPHQHRQHLYDSWLLIRFSIAFVVLCGFQVANIGRQVATLRQAHAASALPPAPDLSAAGAKISFAVRLPGVTAGLVVFVVFGTTRAYCGKMYDAFVPGCVRRRLGREDYYTTTAAGLGGLGNSNSTTSVMAMRRGTLRLSSDDARNGLRLDELEALGRAAYGRVTPPPSSPCYSAPRLGEEPARSSSLV